MPGETNALAKTGFRTSRARGTSLIEMLIGVVVFAVVAIVLGSHVTTSYSSIRSQQDRVFAYTKAQAILSEIHAFVDSGSVGAAIDLDVLDDGVTPIPNLSIQTDANGVLLPPDSEVSRNIFREGGWVWTRQVTVQPFAGVDNRNVRYVNVRIFKRTATGRTELASLSSVVNSVGSAFPTTQEFDVYLLAVENIPGWWVYMEAVIPFVESAVTDLESRNPGLSLRTHWITKAAYGRNPLYRPFTNDAADTYTPSPGVYVYPGRMPAGNASNYYYVPPLIDARISLDGIDTNGYDATTNPFPYTLADFYNHAMRHPAARDFHDERIAAIERREDEIATAIAAGTTPPPPFDDMSKEPTLRLLLDDMATRPQRYRNALLVNLHGELLPVPALNNVSSAAKHPGGTFGLPEARVVSHFEQLRTARPPAGGAEDATLRVYAYLSEPDDPPAWLLAQTGTNFEGKLPQNRWLEVRVMDLDLTLSGAPNELDPAVVDIRCMPGGVPVAGGSDQYPPNFQSAPFYDPTIWSNGEMCYFANFVDPGPGRRKYTQIWLLNTPIVCPEVPELDSMGLPTGIVRGLPATREGRLYGLEYHPSPTRATDFLGTHHLGTPSDGGPKNTARWTIRVSRDAFGLARFCDTASPPNRYDPTLTGDADIVLTAHTSIYNGSRTSGLPGSTGADVVPVWRDLTGLSPRGNNPLYVEPENASETYTWWSDSVDDVPFTERSQFLGDPRHMPYQDLLDGAVDFPNRYNWFHDNLESSQSGWGNARPYYPGLTRLFDKWDGNVRCDVGRYMELLRTALTRSRAVYTTLTGYSYYYLGIGNEIGYDAANGYSNSIPVDRGAWGGSGNGFVNNITGRRALIANRVSSSDDWVGLPWLGELYPDDSYVDFAGVSAGERSARGNLPVGTSGAQEFIREEDRSAYVNSIYEAHGTDLWRSHQRLANRGCVSFFNNGTSGSHFNHHSTNGTGNATPAGLEIIGNYGFQMPASTLITRPFTLDTGGNVPPEFGEPEYSSNRYSATLLRTFYDHSSGRIGSGLVELRDPTANDSAFVVVNGLAQTTQTGTSVIAKYCLLSMLHSYFELGDPALAARIVQPARCEILAPTEVTELQNPNSLTIQWTIDWTRWDGQPYTATLPSGFAENESDLEYVIMYSRDNGDSWLYVQDDQVAEPGIPPESLLYRIPDSGLGDESYTWSVPPSEFPAGTYMLRVETYRTGQSLHYSQHQSRLYIQR